MSQFQYKIKEILAYAIATESYDSPVIEIYKFHGSSILKAMILIQGPITYLMILHCVMTLRHTLH